MRGLARRANNSTAYAAVGRRLRALFYQNDVDGAEVEWLTCSWYRATSSTGQQTQQAVAKDRMQRLWAAWGKCVANDANIRRTGYLQAVAYYIDAHIPLANSAAANLTYRDAVQRKLCPDQCTTQIGISDELTKVVSDLWVGANGGLAISKLLNKGFPHPKSVRYIRPQLLRCAQCPVSKRLARELILNWMLGRYSHRRVVAPPEKRAEVANQTFEELCANIALLPSRSLYYVIAECLAAVTVASTEIHIRAVGVVSKFSLFFDTVAAAAEAALLKPTARLQQCVSVGTVQAILPAKPVTFQQWRCNASTTRKQKESIRTFLGIEKFGKFYCRHCAVLHVKLRPQPRAAKSRLGVSIDLDNPFSETAECNLCGKDAHFLELSGHVTKTMVNKTLETISLCSYCGMLTNDVHVHGTDLCCPACASRKATEILDAAAPCPCGWEQHRGTPHDATRKTCQYVTLRKPGGDMGVAQACPVHAGLAANATLTEDEWRVSVLGVSPYDGSV